MLRLSALYIVERLKPRIMPYLLMIMSQQLQSRHKAAPKPPRRGRG